MSKIKHPNKSKGGLARAKSLSPERRKSIARMGVIARLGLKSTHKGNFKEEFGIDVDCYVLNDEAKTAVISQSGMATALGFQGTDVGSRLPRFVEGKTISKYIGPELRGKLENPLIFQVIYQGPNGKGYDVTILIDICKVIIEMESNGELTKNHYNIAKQAHIILNASAKAGIKGLVYALSGYDATREEVIKAYKVYVKEEAREYEKEFPDELYEQWYRLYGLPKPEKNKPWKFMHLTVNQIYRPLAKSRGAIYEAMIEQRSSQDKKEKLHQFLSDIGVKALRMHFGKIIGIALISKTKEEYEYNFKTLFDLHQQTLF